MTVLVLGGNALLMFVGWEGVGLASYLLIGFWYQRPSAASAGMKAFVVNRIGDFGFLIGMFLLLATLWHPELQRDCDPARFPARTAGRHSYRHFTLSTGRGHRQERTAASLCLAS